MMEEKFCVVITVVFLGKRAPRTLAHSFSPHLVLDKTDQHNRSWSAIYFYKLSGAEAHATGRLTSTDSACLLRAVERNSAAVHHAPHAANISPKYLCFFCSRVSTSAVDPRHTPSYTPQALPRSTTPPCRWQATTVEGTRGGSRHIDGGGGGGDIRFSPKRRLR